MLCTFCYLIGRTTGRFGVCISHLTLLMMDQHHIYSPKCLSSEFVGEVQSDPAARDKILNSDDQLVFITPECIITNISFRETFLSAPYKNNLWH